MKNKNRIQNTINENRTINFELVTSQRNPVIGELLTLTEIEAVITQHVVLSDAAATGLAVRNGDDDFN